VNSPLDHHLHELTTVKALCAAAEDRHSAWSLIAVLAAGELDGAEAGQLMARTLQAVDLANSAAGIAATVARLCTAASEVPAFADPGQLAEIAARTDMIALAAMAAGRLTEFAQRTGNAQQATITDAASQLVAVAQALRTALVARQDHWLLADLARAALARRSPYNGREDPALLPWAAIASAPLNLPTENAAIESLVGLWGVGLVPTLAVATIRQLVCDDPAWSRAWVAALALPEAVHVLPSRCSDVTAYEVPLRHIDDTATLRVWSAPDGAVWVQWAHAQAQRAEGGEVSIGDGVVGVHKLTVSIGEPEIGEDLGRAWIALDDALAEGAAAVASAVRLVLDLCGSPQVAAALGRVAAALESDGEPPLRDIQAVEVVLRARLRLQAAILTRPELPAAVIDEVRALDGALAKARADEAVHALPPGIYEELTLGVAVDEASWWGAPWAVERFWAENRAALLAGTRDALDASALPPLGMRGEVVVIAKPLSRRTPGRTDLARAVGRRVPAHERARRVTFAPVRAAAGGVYQRTPELRWCRTAVLAEAGMDSPHANAMWLDCTEPVVALWAFGAGLPLSAPAPADRHLRLKWTISLPPGLVPAMIDPDDCGLVVEFADRIEVWPLVVDRL